MTLRDRYVVRQEPEGIAQRRVALVILVSIAVALGAVGVAWLVLPNPPESQYPAGREPVEEEVGEVYTTLIRRRAVGLEHEKEDLEHLSEYGWADEDEGVAFIPVERAMEVYLREHTDAGVPK